MTSKELGAARGSVTCCDEISVFCCELHLTTGHWVGYNLPTCELPSLLQSLPQICYSLWDMGGTHLRVQLTLPNR